MKNPIKYMGVMLAAALVVATVIGCVSHNLKGCIALENHDYDMAIAEFTEEIRLHPNNKRAYHNRGMVYHQIKKDYDRAIADQTKAIELDPNNADYYNSRCWTYGNKGEYDKAIADCNQAIRLNSKSAAIYHSRGFAYLGKKDYDKAIADFEAALRIDPNQKASKEDIEKAKRGMDGLTATWTSVGTALFSDAAPHVAVVPAAETAVVDDELNIAMTAQTQAQRVNPYFTGDGGNGISIAIIAPTASGLAKNQNYLPALVQGEFVSNFSGYSAISVLDRERLDTINIELISPIYDDSAIAKQARLIGNLAHTTHIMGGNITKTATGYALQMHITKVDDRTAAASYSGTFTFAELDNLTGVRRASLELLQKMGIVLSEKAQEELAGAAAESRVNAQTALAKGLTAQQEKNEIAALSYYFQAAAFDPSLVEAANRSSKLKADITSGSMGDNIRNDIQWRKDWIARLAETEKFFDNFNKTESMPYTLYYSDDIKQGKVNYQTETVNLSIWTILIANDRWARPMERALQAVYDGLDATERKRVWELDKWPLRGVTNLNAFAKRSQNFSVVFELLNNQNKVIGRETLHTGGFWELISISGIRPYVKISTSIFMPLYFIVYANDITDKMTIRLASVNGTDAGIAAKNGTLQIRTFIKDITAGAVLKDTRDGKSYRTVIIGSQTWMAENLNYQTSNSKCYDDKEANCAKYGRLYDWFTAREACPLGWHLPRDADAEWATLENVIGGSSTAGTKLKSKAGWNNNGNGTDDVGFSALPGGYGMDDGRFGGVGYYGSWWDAGHGGMFAWFRVMYSDSGVVRRREGYLTMDKKSALYSVRCVQD